jgi:hypothetical protein
MKDDDVNTCLKIGTVGVNVLVLFMLTVCFLLVVTA